MLVRGSMAPGFERENATVPFVDQLVNLMASLALNRTLLARILRVSCPMIDEWFAGRRPEAEDQERLSRILAILAQGSVSAVRPLNARFVRRAPDPGLPSLIDLLSNERIDATRILSAIDRARILTEDDEHRRGNREERLRELGFEEPTPSWRRETLARSVGLLDWPKG